MHGDTCFGCGGKGKVLSRQGAAAKKTIGALRERLCTVPAAAVPRGATVLLNRKWRTVTDTQREGRTYHAAGIEAVHLKTANYAHVMTSETPVHLRPTPEQWNALLAKARTLRGATVVAPEEANAGPKPDANRSHR